MWDLFSGARLTCPTGSFLTRVGCLAMILFLAFQAQGIASSRFDPTPKAIFQGADAGPWERVEYLFDSHPGFKQETFLPPTKICDPWIAKWFGGNTAPHSGGFLLHCARNFQGKTFKNPVLLVPGAGDNANRAWIHPFTAVLPQPLPHDKQGFAVTLSDLGYSVFAVSFAHTQGDNFFQAEHVANAIRRIRILLNRTNDPDFKIDVVAHSKGNVAVRLYCSDGRQLFPKKEFLTSYRKDVRKYIGIAAPNRGIDTPFRYYMYNLTVADKGTFNAPVGADSILYYGSWKDCLKISLFPEGGNPFPGQCQILFNLVRDAGVPLGLEGSTPIDANLTAISLYYGGVSALVVSRGIDKAIEAGERLIYRLEEAGLDPSVEVGLIAGSNPAITWFVEGIGFIPLPHEIIMPPGDGVLCLASSIHTEGLVKRGARLIGVTRLFLNHLGVACSEPAFKALDSFLLKP